MNLQKVKEALVRAESTLSNDGYNCTFIREALAELEKPVDGDAQKIALAIGQVFSVFTIRNGGVFTPQEEGALLIQQYAEYYHAKRCGECNKRGHGDGYHNCGNEKCTPLEEYCEMEEWNPLKESPNA